MKEEIQKKKLEKKEDKLHDKLNKIHKKQEILRNKIAIKKLKGCEGKCYKSGYSLSYTRIDSFDIEKSIIKTTTIECSGDRVMVRNRQYFTNYFSLRGSKEVEIEFFNKLYQRALNKMVKWQ